MPTSWTRSAKGTSQEPQRSGCEGGPSQPGVEVGTKATSQGTYTYGGLTWTRHEELHYKWGDGRVNTDDANFSYTKIDEAYSSSTLGGNSTSNYSINTTTNSGLFTMTDGELGNERTFVSAMLMEWVGPPIRISPEALAYARSLADGWEPFSVIDKTDGFFAGWADSLTAGLSTKARAYIYGDDATRNHKGKYFQGGQMVGAVHGTVLAFANPCAMGGVIGAAYRGIQAAGTVGGVINGVDNVRKGNYEAAAWDFLGAAGDLASFLRACFAGDVEVLTRDRGVIRWDQVREGDFLAGCDENDPNGMIEYQPVEEVFVTEAVLWHLHLSNGEVIRTTAEHPFWAYERGWIAARDLQAGDRLRSLSGAEVQVEEVFESGEVERVYNARIADTHTYFVRSPGGAEFVWAHNKCRIDATRDTLGRVTDIVARTSRAFLKTGTAATSAARRIVTRVGDEAGHLIARVLGGPGGRKSGNVVAILKTLNRGKMAQFERKVAGIIRRTNSVATIAAEVTYHGKSFRPSMIQLEVVFSNYPRKMFFNLRQ